MKRFVAIFASLVFAGCLQAQTAKPVGGPGDTGATTAKEAEKELAPKISADVLKQFYAADAAQQRALREQDQARIDVASANESWKQIVDAMQKVCGDKFQLKQDTVGVDPYCAPVPPAPAKK